MWDADRMREYEVHSYRKLNLRSVCVLWSHRCFTSFPWRLIQLYICICPTHNLSFDVTSKLRFVLVRIWFWNASGLTYNSGLIWYSYTWTWSNARINLIILSNSNNSDLFKASFGSGMSYVSTISRTSYRLTHSDSAKMFRFMRSSSYLSHFQKFILQQIRVAVTVNRFHSTNGKHKMKS